MLLSLRVRHGGCRCGFSEHLRAQVLLFLQLAFCSLSRLAAAASPSRPVASKDVGSGSGKGRPRRLQGRRILRRTLPWPCLRRHPCAKRAATWYTLRCLRVFFGYCTKSATMPLSAAIVGIKAITANVYPSGLDTVYTTSCAHSCIQVKLIAAYGSGDTDRAGTVF